MIVENLSQKELFLFLIVIISFLIVKAFGFILHNFYLWFRIDLKFLQHVYEKTKFPKNMTKIKLH